MSDDRQSSSGGHRSDPPGPGPEAPPSGIPQRVISLGDRKATARVRARLASLLVGLAKLGARSPRRPPRARMGTIAALITGIVVAAGWVRPDSEGHDYQDYAPPTGHQPDYYRPLRLPRPRPAGIDDVFDRMESAQRAMMILANGTRWGEDRTVRYLLYIANYDRALEAAGRWRLAYAEMEKLTALDLLEDPSLQRRWLLLRDWGRHTALVLHEPIYITHPYVRIEKILPR